MHSCHRLAACCAIVVAVAVQCCVHAQEAEADRAVAARAEAFARQGQTVQAEQIANAYLQQHPNSVPVNVVAGELQVFRHEWVTAMNFFEAALRTDPNDVPACTGERSAATALALHLRAVHDDEGALAALEHAHTMLPSDIPTLLNLALQAQSMHRLKSAADAVAKALAIAPENDRVLYAAAGIDFDRGDFSAAAMHYGSFLAQHPGDASAHYGLGRALRMQQKNDDAQSELERSIALQPVQTEAYYQLGEIALEAGHDEAAKKEFEKTLKRMPTHGGALTGMGMLDYRAHDYAAAKAALTQAVAAAPDYQPAHYYLGLTLRRLDDADGAERELHTATELATKQQGKSSPIAAQ